MFPQLEGLGSSGTARAFAIRGADEARQYLRDPDLRTRLLAIATAVVEQLRTGKDFDAHGIRYRCQESRVVADVVRPDRE